MMTFAFYLLKVIICSGILFLYYLLALRNKQFHQWNRFYLLAAVLLSLTVPFIQVTITQHLKEANPSPIHLLQVVQAANTYLDNVTITQHKATPAGLWVTVSYLFISLLILVASLLSLVKVRLLIKTHTVQWIDSIRFINTAVPEAPFSF